MPTIDTGDILQFPLDGSRITLGRDRSCGVVLSGLGVSRLHAAIDLDEAGCTITDLNSTFGLRINGVPAARHRLAAGDIVTIGVRQFTVDVRPGALVLQPFQEPVGRSGSGAAAGDGGSIRIGRDPAADLVLPHPLVSRFHASAQKLDDGTFVLADQHSTNGSFVNGRRVTRSTVDEGDIVQIGPYRLFVEQGRLVKADEGNRIRLEAFDVTVRAKNTLLLDNVSLTVPAGEFVAVLGMSGAGKSTLVRALCGRQKIDGGAIYANSLPLRQFLNAFTANIGFVAQDNLLHRELTVEETFSQQSLLRLPRDSTDIERRGRIDEVTRLLELDRVQRSRISRLSGGEAKRVHLGVELLASPALIVLDEPLAGLDPGLVRKFMRLFRRICDQGHTILLATHLLEQIEFCDRLVFMHRGRIVFNGQPSELEPFFGKKSLPDVYEQVADGLAPPAAGPAGQQASGPPAAPAAAVRLRKPRALPFLRQLGLLFSRYATIMHRDRRNLLLLLLQAPAIALFLGFVFVRGADFLPSSFYFCVTISAIWISGINAAQELAREWRMLDREWRAGLSLRAYLSAKIGVSLVSALAQAVLFWFSLCLIFRHFPLSAYTLLLVAAGTVSGAVLGLCISAFSGTSSRAITVLPMIFIPQIFFSGILGPFDRMSEIGQWLSYCTYARPVFSLFKFVCQADQPIFKCDAWLQWCILSIVLIILMTVAVRLRCARQ